jgi:hypothetical protein
MYQDASGQALAAAGTAIVGGTLLSGMTKIIDRSGEFARTMDRMRLAGWSVAEIGHAVENAFSTARATQPQRRPDPGDAARWRPCWAPRGRRWRRGGAGPVCRAYRWRNRGGPGH